MKNIPSKNISSPNAILIGPFICVGTSIAFVIASESCAHWFILPITLCGMILVIDAQNWASGKMGLFEPRSIIALLGLHYFYFAPILHVYWDSWMLYVTPPPDWRPWLGYMGVLNFAGLTIFKFIIKSNLQRKSDKKLRQHWQLSASRFKVYCWLAIIITLSSQLYVYHQFGGVEGYIKAFESNSDAFRGMGWIFLISESFPIVVFIAYAIASTRYEILRKWGIIFLVLFLFVVLKMIFGGLRGSRSNTIWGVFWAVGIIHFWVRPLNRKIIIAGLVSLVCFMYSYGLYKTYGSKIIEAFTGPRIHREMAYDSGRTIDKTLLGDLARSDVQALLLYKLLDSESSYKYKWGITYLHALTLLIPSSIRPILVDKRQAGTEIQYGAFQVDFLSSRIYGLTGEAMLNWGILAIPCAFAIFGLLIAKITRFIIALPAHDTRVLLIPFFVNFSFLALAGDSDNLVFFLIKNGAVPILLLWSSSKITKVNAHYRCIQASSVANR